MKRLRLTLLLTLVLTGAVTPVSAECLSRYNAALIRCDTAYCSNGTLTCFGCYQDALLDYYGCIEQQVVS